MRGFTLLEIMIALAIMAGTLLTVITSYNHHLAIAARDRDETVAVLLARGKLDDPLFRTNDAKSGTFPEWPGYRWEKEIAPSDYPGVDRLDFTVTWGEGRHSLSLVRYQPRSTFTVAPGSGGQGP